MLLRALGVIVVVALVAHSAHAADVKRFLKFPFVCTAGYPLPTLTRGANYYYEFTGSKESKLYTVCRDAGGAWGGEGPGNAASSFSDSCQRLDLASFRMMCSGGVVSAPAIGVTFDVMAKANGYGVTVAILQGDTLFVSFSSNRGVQTRALPAGYGTVHSSVFNGEYALAWDSTRGIPIIPVSGNPPVGEPRVEPAPAWVRFLADVFPWGQLIVGMCMLGFGFVARAGYARGLGNPDEAKKLRLLIVVGVALLGLALSAGPASLPESSLQQARQQLQTARAQVAAVEQKRVALASIFHTTGGMVQPIDEPEMRRVAALTQPYRIDAVSDPQPMPELWALLSLAPAGLLFLFFFPRFVIGCDYVFRKHPAEPIIMPAVRSGTALNASKLADALTPDIRDLELRKPAFRHKHDVEKARALKEKLDADAELADAAIQREQKRSELQRKRAEIEKLERELGEQKGKRRRWL